MTPKEAKDLLGFPDNCVPKIKAVGGECFRVNVYETYSVPDSVIPRTRLHSSAYVCNTKDGYKDITIRGK